VSEKRLSLLSHGKMRYELKTPYRDGTTHVSARLQRRSERRDSETWKLIGAGLREVESSVQVTMEPRDQLLLHSREAQAAWRQGEPAAG
jgi:hypothetical protein